MSTTLFHVSEERGIAAFEPRIPSSQNSGIAHAVVWAVDEQRLHNYLTPRDCPRVTFYPSERSNEQDVRVLMGSAATVSRAVIAIEAGWVARVRETRIFLYELPPIEFALADAAAGYWVSTQRVVPTGVVEISDCIDAILARNIELRVVQSLWPLYDAVIKSSLEFSCIRMRNARARES